MVATTTRADDEVPAAPEAPATPPPADVAHPAGQNAAAPQDNSQDLVTLTLPNVPLSEVLAAYERITGKRLIKDVTSLAAAPQGNAFSLVIPGQIPRAEAIRLVETLLLLNNIILVPGPDNTVKVMGLARNVRSEAISLYTSPESLPASDQVVSYYMRLNHISATDAATVLNGTSPIHPYGNIQPIPNAQAVVITENSSTIRKLIALKEMIDVPPAKTISEFVQLERADAETVSKTLNDIIKARKSSSAPSVPGQPAPPPVEGEQPPAQAPTSSGGEGTAGGETQLIPDTRTNRILVITQKANFDYIKKLIAQFDQAVDLVQPLEFPLKYISASEVLPVLQNILTEGKESGGAGAAPATPGQPAAQQPASTTTTTSSGETSDQLAPLQAPNQDTTPKSINIGKTHIVADPKANSILVFGPPENRQKILTVLTRLDKKPLQVYLSTVIGQLTLEDGFEFGIDYLQNFSRISNDRAPGVASSMRSTSLAAQSALPNPAALTTSAAFGALNPGLTVYGIVNHTLSAYLRALQTTDRFKIISRPSVFTENNKLATISSGAEVPVPDSILSNLNTGVSNSVAQNATIQFKKVVLKLQVIPLINSEKEVKLQVAQQNDSLTGSSTISGITVPTIGTQTITTTINLHDRETAIIGGLIQERNETATSGLPFLSKIPLIGYLFKDTNKTKHREELMILIQPTIVEKTSDLVEIQREENARSEVANDAFQTAESQAPAPTPPQSTLRMRAPTVRADE